jgi:hypothetical protein
MKCEHDNQCHGCYLRGFCIDAFKVENAAMSKHYAKGENMSKKADKIDEKIDVVAPEPATIAVPAQSNIYQRLQLARALLKDIEIKETGTNKFAEYSYLELKDFLPHVTRICSQVGICPVVTFELEWCYLTLFNVENPTDNLVFNSQVSTATLRGCHPIQNLGAVQSYLRRYLYINAFEICEIDALDRTTGKEKIEDVKPAPVAEPPKPPKTAQVKPLPKPAAAAMPEPGHVLPPGESDAGFEDFETIEEHDERYFQRIKMALEILFNDNVFKKKALIVELTTFTRQSDNVVIPGNPDYRNKTGKSLEVLTHEIERLAKKHTQAAVTERQPGEEG